MGFALLYPSYVIIGTDQFNNWGRSNVKTNQGLGFMGYSNNSPTVLLAAFVWWILCQTIAHLLMSLEDGD